MDRAKNELTAKERILERISSFFPPAIISQIKEKDKISSVDGIRMLSLLPPEAFEKFPSIPHKLLTFPRDHNRHYFQPTEEFSLCLNLKTIGHPKIPNSRRRVGVSASISCHTVDPQNPALFSLEKTNQLFRSSFAITMGASDSQKCEHWYMRDSGGFVGDYRPAVVDGLPSITFGHDDIIIIDMENNDAQIRRPEVQGFMPFEHDTIDDRDDDYDDCDDLKKIRWRMTDPSGAMIDILLTLPVENAILLNGKDGIGTTSDENFGSSKMSYSFKYLQAKGIVVFPPVDGTQRAFNVSGAGWFDHVGEVSKKHRGIAKHMDEWKSLLKMPQHRRTSIITKFQFPQKQIFIHGSVENIHPQSIKKEASFPWKGSVTTRGGHTKFYEDGVLTVKATFKSPSTKNVLYTTDVELAVGNQVFSLAAICSDQRTFPAHRGEIYEAAADCEILSDSKTVKPKGVGFLTNHGFSNYRQMEEHQLEKLDVAPLLVDFSTILTDSPPPNGSITEQSTTGPVLIIVALLSLAAFVVCKACIKKTASNNNSA